MGVMPFLETATAPSYFGISRQGQAFVSSKAILNRLIASRFPLMEIMCYPAAMTRPSGCGNFSEQRKFIGLKGTRTMLPASHFRRMVVLRFLEDLMAS